MKWFTEADLPDVTQNIRLSTRVSDVLFDEKSDWGHVQVFDTPFYGTMLAIDGIIQVTTSDEFIYHEMMVNLPGILQGNPQKILIAGGGDGGALKCALRFKSLQGVTQVEIDSVVSEVCRKYLPSVSDGSFEHPKTTLVFDDAYEFIKNSTEQYDVIVLDLTDPVEGGPAQRLFSEEFFELVKARLTDRGIMTIHCGSLFFQQQEIKDMLRQLRHVFPAVQFRNAVVPSYQLTSFGFLYGSKSAIPELTKVEFNYRLSNVEGENKFLNYAMYRATAALPPYLEDLARE